jgi:hypothetical protein
MCPCLSWQSARGSGTAYTTALLLVILDCILGGVRLVHLEAPIPPVVAWPDLASIPNCLQQRDTRNQPSARQKKASWYSCAALLGSTAASIRTGSYLARTAASNSSRLSRYFVSSLVLSWPGLCIE